MSEKYREEITSLFEKFLLDNNIYSQFATYILEHGKMSLSELFEHFFRVSSIYKFPDVLICYYGFHNRYPFIHTKWYECVEKYKIEHGL